MKAVLIYKYGGPEELKYEETVMPEINPDDVLVKVIATSINPIDWKVRKGDHGKDRKLPAILGWDVAGVIEKVGDNVLNYKAGDEVYGRPDPSRNGTYAQYVAVRAAEIYFKPKTLDHINAAAVPLAGLTAWQGIFDHGQLQAGQKNSYSWCIGRCGYFCYSVC